MSDATNLPELPKGWKWAKIEEICDVKGRVGWRGYKKTDLRSKGPYVIGATHLSDDYRLDLTKPVFLSNEKFFESPEIMVNLQDIIIAQRGSLGKLSIVDFDMGNATINPCVLLMKNIKILNLYLLYCLASPTYNNQLIKGNKSTTTPMITQKFLKNLNIPIPPFNEQKRIVEKIEELFTKLDASVEDLLSIKENLDIYRKSILNSIFLENDNRISLEKACKKITDGSHNPPKRTQSGEIMLSAKDISNDKISFNSPRFVSEQDFIKENKRTNITVGDVLLTIVGSIGRTAVVNKGMPRFVLQRSVAVLKPDDILNPKYLSLYLRSPKVFNEINQKSRGVAQKGIYLGTLKKITIGIPNISRQNEIVTEIESRFSVIDKIEEIIDESIIKKSQLKASTLKKAFLGKLVKQNPDDEPADVLLKKINKSK